MPAGWRVSPLSTDDAGQPTEQTKAKLADPSGNVIELKTYVDVTAALELTRGMNSGAMEHGNRPGS
jgi:extradiol dioxygenase family protein